MKTDWILPDAFRCGYYDSEKVLSLVRTPPRTVEVYEIELFLEDGHTVILNSREIPVKKDLILIARPGDIRCSILHFKTAFVKFSARGALAGMLDQLPRSFFTVHGEQLRALMHEILLLSETRQPDMLFLQSRFLLFLSLLRADAERPLSGGATEYEMMRRARLFIQSHYAEKITMRDAAASVNLSESHFRTLFRSAYGIPPHQFLTETRIEAAKQMLWHTDISLAEIAESCGFGCQQYFCDVFRRQTGQTPRVYRTQFAQRYAT